MMFLLYAYSILLYIQENLLENLWKQDIAFQTFLLLRLSFLFLFTKTCRKFYENKILYFELLKWYYKK